MRARRKPYPSTGGVLPRPACLLCGITIPDTHQFGLGKGHCLPLIQERQWKGLCKPGVKHVMVPSCEVENTFTSNSPRLWSCLYRALIKESDTKYRLTGINVMQDRPYYTPNDPTKARISGSEHARYNGKVFTRFYAASIERQPREYKGKTIGYFVHAHCWALFGQIEGLTLNVAPLAKFVQVCRKYWKNNELWEIWSDMSPLDHWDMYRNPFVVPAIHEAIDCKKMERYPPSSCFSNLPLEIALLICQLVCPVTDYTEDDIKDTKSLLLVFGWELPEWFWRARLNCRLFFELEKMRKAGSPVCWQSWLNLMNLVADRSRFVSTSLANRERIMGVMRDLDKAYTN
ncbi:hypothetical protein N7501_008147 [Penicillium viridicatum]|nr:hypothetical protein N7501_008147 [Penicillium viridicatum]